MSELNKIRIIYFALGLLATSCTSHKKTTEKLGSKQTTKISLVRAAKKRVSKKVKYDGAYKNIDYPYGDINHEKGVCSDVVIRSYRKIGVDLQSLVFSDMSLNFDDYPKLYNQDKPDPSIDHRRVPNLNIFFKKYGKNVAMEEDFQPGDILIWQSKKVPDHIAIVTGVTPEGVVYVHNQGKGPEYGKCISCSNLVGHYRF